MTRTTVMMHISEIRPGDTVHHDGHDRTVGVPDIKHGGFMGSTLFGDAYTLGRRPVVVVLYNGFRGFEK